jgi:hypothetical protein
MYLNHEKGSTVLWDLPESQSDEEASNPRNYKHITCAQEQQQCDPALTSQTEPQT